MGEGEAAQVLVRERIHLSELPTSLEAFAVYPMGKRPKDRKGRLRPRVVEINGVGSLERFAPSTDIDRDELIWFLRSPERRWTGVASKWGPRARQLVFALAACGGLTIRARLDERYRIEAITKMWLTPYWAEMAPEKLVELTGKARPEQTRIDLLDALADLPMLADEYALLAAQRLDAALVPPFGTRTGATRWSPYEFALRVAAWWYRRLDPTRKPPLDEATAWAFPGRDASKEEWTAPRRLAVENTLGAPLTELMTTPDYEIRVRGPLQWKIGSVAADARVARPWTGLPSNGARLIGEIDFTTAMGVFVIENQTTFQEVCSLPAIAEDWIIVWGKGYAAHGLVELLRNLASLPVAVWGDLDADGINIIADMERKLGRVFHPVGMDPEYWTNGPHRRVKPGQRARSISLAARLAATGPLLFRELAERIVKDAEMAGGSREQQTLHDTVLPLLPDLLSAILANCRSAPPAAMGQ